MNCVPWLPSFIFPSFEMIKFPSPRQIYNQGWGLSLGLPSPVIRSGTRWRHNSSLRENGESPCRRGCGHFFEALPNPYYHVISCIYPSRHFMQCFICHHKNISCFSTACPYNGTVFLISFSCFHRSLVFTVTVVSWLCACLRQRSCTVSGQH